MHPLHNTHIHLHRACYRSLVQSLLILSGAISCVVDLAGASFTLAWKDNSTNETGFTIERAPGLNATSGFVAVANVAKDVTSWKDPNLPVSTPFSYRVCAYNAKGKSGYTNVASGTTSELPSDATVPGAPTGAEVETDAPYVPPVVTINATLTIQGDKILAANVDAKPEARP